MKRPNPELLNQLPQYRARLEAGELTIRQIARKVGRPTSSKSIKAHYEHMGVVFKDTKKNQDTGEFRVPLCLFNSRWWAGHGIYGL